MEKKGLQQRVYILAVLGSLVLLNVLGLRIFGRLDVTREKAYTLSKASEEILAALEEPLKVTAYFTANLPAPYSSNARYVRDLLDEFRAASNNRLAYEFIDPQAQETQADKEKKREVKQDIFGRRFREPTSIEKELTASGIQSVDIHVIEEDQQQTKRAYMALVLNYEDKQEVIPLVQNVQSLEYNITSLILKLTRLQAPTIGVLQEDEAPKLNEKFRLLSTILSQTYEVRSVRLDDKKRFDDDLDALYLLGPKTALEPNALEAIDQFLMAGKAAAFFLDTVHVDMRTFEHTPAAHGMTELLSTYGVTIGNRLVADAISGNVTVSERRGFMVVQRPMPYPFIPIVKRLDGTSPITQGLGGVGFPFTTSVDAKALEGTKVLVLASSSPKSWLAKAQPYLDPRRDWRQETILPSGPYPLLVQLSGQLKSHFAAKATQSGTTPTVLAETQSEARLVVAGSSALLRDNFMQNRGNQALLLNIADWLLLDPALLAMRNRGLALPTLQDDLSDGTRNFAKFGNALGVPLLLALIGVVRWRMREANRKTVTI